VRASSGNEALDGVGECGTMTTMSDWRRHECDVTFMRHARGARSRSRSSTSAYGPDDYVASSRVALALAREEDDVDDARLRGGALLGFEAHALARASTTLVVGGCAPALEGDAVMLFARGDARRWTLAEGARGVACASAAEGDDDDDETFALGMMDGSVWTYARARREDSGTKTLYISLIRRVTPPGWGRAIVSARDAAATRASRLATTRASDDPGRALLLARHGGGGTSLAVWDAMTMEPLTASGECKGFASMVKSTWIGTSSAYARVGESAVATTSMDQKSVMCVRVRSNGKCELVWRSRREPGRGIFLAGTACVERGRGATARVATCSCDELVAGTTYAAPDSSLKLVVLDAEDGSEVNRFPIEGLGASNVFIDCGSLCAVGTNVFLAHRDGSVWVVNSGNGALVTSLHPPQEFCDTSGHRRTLPSLLAVSPARDEMHGATCDGGVVNAWRVGTPTYWSRATHARFPESFRNAVRTMLLCAHAWSSPSRALSRVQISPKERVVGVDDEIEKLRHVEGFLDAVGREPALLEMIIARMARAEYGCDIVDAFC